MSWGEPHLLILFGTLDDIETPAGLPFDWFTHLNAVCGMLGLGAASSALVLWLRPFAAPWLATITAAALVLGVAFMALWLLDPPDAPGAGAASFDGVGWAGYVATAALAVGAIAAGAIASRDSRHSEL